MKTRHTLLLMLTFILSTFAVQEVSAQQVQDALYIFRNDGKFNAFFYADIRHIEYSQTDTLGQKHDDYVVQEIHTADSVYRIPVSAIDSVAFVTPENKVRADVTVMPPQLTEYIVASDSARWFRLSTSAPVAVIPKVGDKLLVEDSVAYLPYGFAGKVTAVDKTADGTTVTTEYVGLLDIYDRYVAKAAAVPTQKSQDTEVRSQKVGRRADDYWQHEIDISYQTAEPIELPAFTGNMNLTMSGDIAVNKKQTGTISLDGVATATWNFEPKVWINAFLYADAAEGIRYHQDIRTEGQESLMLNFSGILNGHLDLPFTIASEAVKRIKQAALKEGGKAIIKKLGDFNVELSWGLFLELQGSANKNFGYEGYGHHRSVYTYEQKAWQTPDPELGFARSSSNYDNIKEVDNGWSSNTTFNVGLYAKASVGLKKFENSEAGLRAEGGLRLEEQPAVAWDAVAETAYSETGKLYTILNRENDVTRSLFGNIQAYAKIGRWQIINLKPEVTVFKKGFWGFVPNISDVTWTPDEKVLYRGTVSAPISRRLLNSKTIGFAIFDENGRQVENYWYIDYLSPDIFSSYNKTFDHLDPDHHYTVIPQLKVYGLPMLTNVKADFTLGPAKIDIDPGNQVLTDASKKLIEVDEYSNFISDLKVQTNIFNSEMVMPQNAPWLSTTLGWEKDEGVVSLTVDALPESTDRREAAITFVGRDSTGTKVLKEEKLTIRQVRPSIKAKPSPMVFDAKGGTQTLTLTTSLETLSAYVLKEANPDEFCSIGKVEGKDGKFTLKVTAKENNGEENREATIVIEGATATGKKEQLIVYVQQAPPVKLTIEVSMTEVELKDRLSAESQESDVKTVNVTSSYFTADLEKMVKSIEAKPSATWIKTKVESKTVKIWATANTADEPRSGKVTVVLTLTDGETASADILVNQAAKAPVPQFNVTPEKIEFGPDGGEKTITVVGEGIVRIHEIDMHSSNWLGGVASGMTATLVAQENISGADRSQDFTITVIMTDGQKVSQTFTAKQSAEEALELLVAGGLEKEIDETENILNLGIWTNCDTFTAESDATSWLTATANVEASNVIIKAEENETNYARTGHITLTGTKMAKNGGEPRTVEVVITVKQKPAAQEVGYEALWGTWDNGAMTVTFGKNGSYKVDAKSYTQTGSYKITSWIVVQSGAEAGEVHGKLDETHKTSSTGNTKTNTGVGFWISADGKKLSYMNYGWTKK